MSEDTPAYSTGAPGIERRDDGAMRFRKGSLVLTIGPEGVEATDGKTTLTVTQTIVRTAMNGAAAPRPEHPRTMVEHEDCWYWMDEFRAVWRLRPSCEPGMPFVIELESKYVPPAEDGR